MKASIYLKVSLSRRLTTVKSIARDDKVYLEKVGGDPMKLVNVGELEKYMTTMIEDLDYKPSTRRGKLTRIKFAIKNIKRSVDDERLYYKANRVIDTIEEWCQGLGKNISLQRKEHGLLVREQLPSCKTLMNT